MLRTATAASSRQTPASSPVMARAQGSVRRHAPALAPGLLTVALMILWAAHDGGYDADTWYWGSLVVLTALAVVLVARGAAAKPSLTTCVALGALALYVAWSYLSISWAQSPGDALAGSNRALLYLLLFALMAVLPWTSQAALATLLAFVLSLGVLGLTVLVRLLSTAHPASMVIEGRLVAPTGYFNATAALFTIGALLAIVLGSRRQLPALLRGCLLAIATVGLDLALIVQSRGWLFTLPLVALAAIAVVRDRLRVVAASVLPAAAALIPLSRLLAVYNSPPGPALEHAAHRAGQTALLASAATLVVATLLAYGDRRLRPVRMRAATRNALGCAVAALALAVVGVGAFAATHGHPGRFIERQWRGFSHEQAAFASGSHFSDAGSGRYDFWRASLAAFGAHPIGGLGQDNFADYYVTRRHTTEEPSWTHSLEIRLLVHTGIVGLLLFGAFLIAAVIAALRARRREAGSGVPVGAIAAACLLPLVVWLIHGSIDWFWEIPALTGPALAFLAIAGALHAPAAAPAGPRRPFHPLVVGAGALALAGAVVVLGFPYLAVREVSSASDLRARAPASALHDLAIAAQLDPLSADPGRLGGTIALQNGLYQTAQRRFDQATGREPGGWYAWLGTGLAASALGERALARRDFRRAYEINSAQYAVQQALARVSGPHALKPSEGLALLVLAH